MFMPYCDERSQTVYFRSAHKKCSVCDKCMPCFWYMFGPKSLIFQKTFWPAWVLQNAKTSGRDARNIKHRLKSLII
jgi:hypothetical protein